MQKEGSRRMPPGSDVERKAMHATSMSGNCCSLATQCHKPELLCVSRPQHQSVLMSAPNLRHSQLPNVPSSQGLGNIRNAPFLELDKFEGCDPSCAALGSAFPLLLPSWSLASILGDILGGCAGDVHFGDHKHFCSGSAPLG